VKHRRNKGRALCENVARTALLARNGTRSKKFIDTFAKFSCLSAQKSLTVTASVHSFHRVGGMLL
jgi:hypothetical protein